MDIHERFRLASGGGRPVLTGHSGRHTLPSLSAAAQVAKEQRDYLGRWSAAKHGSQDYVLTSRQVVHNVQSTTCRAILEGIPKPGIVEEECLNEIQEYFVKRGGPPLQLKRQLRCLEWNDEEGTWSLGGSFPLINMSPGVFEQAKGSPSTVLPENAAECIVAAPYFVTVSRTGFRRLHASHSCAVRQQRCRETVPIFEVTDSVADAVCKRCRPADSSRPESSSSGSESDEPPGDQEGD